MQDVGFHFRKQLQGWLYKRYHAFLHCLHGGVPPYRRLYAKDMLKRIKSNKYRGSAVSFKKARLACVSADNSLTIPQFETIPQSGAVLSSDSLEADAPKPSASLPDEITDKRMTDDAHSSVETSLTEASLMAEGATKQKRALLHASLLTASEPLSLERLQQVLELSSPEAVQHALDDLSQTLQASHLGVMLESVAQGYRLVVEPQVGRDLAPLLQKRSRSGLSQAALETLALIAYHQPVTRSHLEQVRGASCSSTLETLQEHALIAVVGYSDSIGKPRLFGTTQAFLLEFGLRSLEDLPSLETPKAFVRS